MSKKVVLKVEIHDDKQKQKVLKAVSSVTGIESLSMDMKDKKLTVVGNVDPVGLVGKLRKVWHTDIVSVGPAKEPDKKKEEEEKKKKEEEEKKKKAEEEKKKAEEKMKEEEKLRKELYEKHLAEYIKMQKLYNYQIPYPYYYTHHQHQHQNYGVYSAEENPNSCVIS